MAKAAAAKQKIVILGGGVASVAAAWELTKPAGWQDRYDITLYQMGWRLGGKGASGRNADKRDRIEEHGLHIWMGMYENAFRLMQECYGELGRPPGSPMATWQDAFKKHSYEVMMEEVNGQWIPWSFTVPTNDAVPGHGGYCLSLFNVVRRLIQWIHDRFERGHQSPEDAAPSPTAPLAHARRRAEALSDHAHLHPPTEHQAIVAHLDEFRRHLPAARAAPSHQLRRDLLLFELAATLARGLLVDRVFKSFDPLDSEDFREWFRRHGASQEALDSAPIRCIYEMVFAYENGDTSRPSLAAGVALRFLLRTVFAYQGAFIYKMQAGMGDVVFAPLYLALKKRGVQFKFFHRVDNLGVSPDGRSIASIRIARQATVPAGEYHPLTPVKGLDCWPAQPLFGQLDPTEARNLQALYQRGIEPLESAWTPWQDAETLTLKEGVDFHAVVLGISLGALKYVCKDLLPVSSKWRDMVNKVRTVQTQGFQLWLNRTAHDMGVDAPERVILDSYRNSWSDMSQVIPWENWPDADNVRNIAYWCNTLADAPHIPDPSNNPTFQLQQVQRVKDISLDYLKTGLTRPIWTKAVNPTNPDHLNWDYLVDPTGAAGEQRFDSQFWRANIDPTERYVQSVPNSTQYRLKAGESGFTNLYLAGDWLNTGINAGCIEAAVMGGMQASRALSGSPKKIFGEADFCPSPFRAGCLNTVSGVFAALGSHLQTGRGAAAVQRLLGRKAAKPLYVERGGEQVLSQPVAFRDVKFYGFLLDSNLSALHALADKYLNDPAGGRVWYVPLVPRVLLGVACIGRMQSLMAPDSNKGWGKEIDVSFWVPLLALKRGLGAWSFLRLVWFQPYLVVDNAWAVAAGREIYGFPKEMGQIQAPQNPGDPALFTVDTLVLDPFAPNTEAQSKRLLEIRRLDAGTIGAPARRWDIMAEAYADFLEAVLAGEELIRLPVSGLAIRRHELAFQPRVTSVFLKQFRDAADGRRACFQSIVEAPARITQLRSIGALDGRYEVTIARFASHPIIAELGLSGSVQPTHGWYVDFDFTMENGQEIWSA